MQTMSFEKIRMGDYGDKGQGGGERVQVVSFQLASEEYGVDISQVQEIIRMVEITHVPRAPRFMEGVINLRGQLIPIIDLRTRFGMARAEHTKSTRIVVTEIGSKRVGMVVDSVSEVLNIPLENVEDAPDMIAGVGTEYIQGVGKVNDRLIILLDLTMVIDGEEKQQLETIEAATA
jgi:purine-binding chemotaxis protein CheW